MNALANQIINANDFEVLSFFSFQKSSPKLLENISFNISV